jgi:hypothetical protein
MWWVKGIIYWLMALLAVGIGLAIITWVLYNILIDTQPQYTGPNYISPWSFGIGVPMVGIGVFWFRRGYQHLSRRSSREVLTRSI